jgi:pimeloyl-ACP methyl ester carboxylesterase
VRFLVTVAIPHPASLRPSLRLLWGARHFLRFRRSNAEAHVRTHDFAYVDELVRRWSPPWWVPAGETDAVKEVFRRPECLKAALGYYRAAGPRAQTALLRPITVPSVVFSGEDDGVLRPEHYERARRFYRERYEIIQMPGGHFLHREHPERFIEELLRVLPRGE